METTAMTVFSNKEFGSVRTVTINEQSWFVGKDIAECLGYSNSSKAVSSHVDDEDKQMIMLDIADSQNGNVPSGKTKTTFINESGIYSLIFSSKLPAAKKFKKWVTSEVLPSLRKTGTYSIGQISQTYASNIVIQLTSDVKLPPAKKSWYLKNRKVLRALCDAMEIDLRTLYHLILVEIDKSIDFRQAESIYTRDHGYAPVYAMDVVEYFTDMQKIADEYLARLLAEYELKEIA